MAGIDFQGYPLSFQSPEGGSLGLQEKLVFFLSVHAEFQSPEGGSLGLQAETAATAKAMAEGFSPPKGAA